MNMREEILRDFSKVKAMEIAAYIGKDQKRFDTLIDLFLYDESLRVTQRSAWILSHVSDHHPPLLKPHIKKLWINLQKPQSDAIKRNTLRVFQDFPIPKSVQGIAATICFDYLADPNEAIAIHVFAMSVLFNIGKEEPDLLPELKMMIEEMLPNGSPGIRSRGNRILKGINALSRHKS